MLTERTIINALILAASFILVPFIISESLTVDYLPALVLFAIVFLIISFFWIKESLAISPFISEYITGGLNFLPIAIGFVGIASIFLILYYVTGYVIIRQRSIRLGKTMVFWPLMVIIGIVLYHNHSLKVAAMGASEEGAKPALFMYLGTIAYFCGINLPTPSVRVMSRIPRYCVIATVVSSIPYLLTTFVPSLAPYLFVITSSVNVESYVDSVTGNTAITKLAALGPLGSCLQLYVLAHYPIASWLRPERWWILALSLCCMILVASSGYRSDMFAYFFTIILGAWCYYSWRAAIIPAVAIVALLVLVTASNNKMINLPVRKLPMITQRTLSFLPGDWDPDAVESAKGSNEFRDNIKDVYIKEYMRKSPLIGNGFTIDTPEFHYWDDQLDGRAATTSGNDHEYIQAKAFIEGKMYHTGWISVYDCVGFIGTLGFIGLGINLIRLNARFLFGPKADKRSSLYPLYVWLFCNIVTGFVGYWTVFGSFSDEVIGLLTAGIVLSHLADLAEKTEAPVLPLEMQGHVEMPRISGAYYGRR